MAQAEWGLEKPAVGLRTALTRGLSVALLASPCLLGICLRSRASQSTRHGCSGRAGEAWGGVGMGVAAGELDPRRQAHNPLSQDPAFSATVFP